VKPGSTSIDGEKKKMTEKRKEERKKKKKKKRRRRRKGEVKKGRNLYGQLGTHGGVEAWQAQG